jgi:2,3,4,5-tetrahydropyridine-2,6-dicarboxylate N-succinyltransferase
MSFHTEQSLIEHSFTLLEQGNSLTPAHHHTLSNTIKSLYSLLSAGTLSVTEKKDGQWIVHSWIKKIILLSFQLFENNIIESPFGQCFDKIPLKTLSYQKEDFKQSQFRMVPGALVRESAYIGPRCILMPCFINLGAHIGEGSMIDTWATVGSCARIGKHVHLSGGVGIGGVLEPLQAQPTIIEDHCFIGARSEIVEGVLVEEGSVISMGVFIGQSTKIYDRRTGQISYGRIPPYSVVVPGSLPSPDGSHSLACAIIIKQVDEKTRQKTSINALLRDTDNAL